LSLIALGLYGEAKIFAETELMDSSLSFVQIVRRAIELKSRNSLSPEMLRTTNGRNNSLFETLINILYRFSMRR